MSESDRCRFKSWDISAPCDVGKAGSWSPGDPVGNSVSLAGCSEDEGDCGT